MTEAFDPATQEAASVWLRRHGHGDGRATRSPQFPDVALPLLPAVSPKRDGRAPGNGGAWAHRSGALVPLSPVHRSVPQ
ncbi:MAG: hypothetical protein ACRD0P_27695 [Stackebrandtia sp.]